MKRIKWYLATAALIAIGSAFTVNHKQIDEYGPKSDGTFELLDPEKRGQNVPGGWDCTPEPTVCTYKLKPNATAPYDASEVEPNETGKTFTWIQEPL